MCARHDHPGRRGAILIVGRGPGDDFSLTGVAVTYSTSPSVIGLCCAEVYIGRDVKTAGRCENEKSIDCYFQSDCFERRVFIQHNQTHTTKSQRRAWIFENTGI